MVSFSPDISLGNALTFLTLVGMLVKGLNVLKQVTDYDKKIDIRHEENLNARATDRNITARIERKLDENTTETRQVGQEIAEHVVEDRVFHEEFRRSLDETRRDVKEHQQRNH